MDESERAQYIKQLGWLLLCLPLGLGWAWIKRGGSGHAEPPLTDQQIAKRECDNGNADSCVRADSLRRACDLGSGLGCDLIGRQESASQDYISADADYTKACTLGYQEACASRAALYRSGLAPADATAALSWFEKRCDANDAHGCALAGARYADTANDARAASLFEACSASDAFGCARLGRAYAEGRGVQKNDVTALAKFRDACNRDQKQCLDAGRAYAAGRGAPKDHAKALALFTQACNAGDQDACAAARE